mmetsp:Transcript_41490/g.63322  ORF Transcript_41490/g.63322 Transcript_41490/m.63322 type:complete len:91 (+) Transcript_41490:1107-1379(+)
MIKVMITDNVLYFVRFVGSFIVYFDVFAKFSYFSFSRFSSLFLKEIYWGFLWFRPVILTIIILYNFMIGLKLLWRSYRTKDPKYKDDITY